MARERQTIGNCPKCGAAGLACSYNHFASDDLAIDSWEHKCADCGYRDTTAYRSDDELDSEDEVVDPLSCPYCSRRPAA